MQTGQERKPLKERLSEILEQAQQAEKQDAARHDLSEKALQSFEASIKATLKSARHTISADIKTAQDKINGTLNGTVASKLDNHLRASEDHLLKLEKATTEATRLARKNRLLKLSMAVLLSSLMTLAGMMVLDRQLRGAVLLTALDQARTSDYPILILDTKTGTYSQCQTTAESLSCFKSE